MKSLLQIRLIALSVLFVAITCTLNAQNNFWTFPEQAWIPGGNIIPLPTSGYNGSPSNYTHAGIMDPYGEIVFTKIDYSVYDKNGNNAGSFYGGTNADIAGSGEALIVPQPGSCERFYIFQAGENDGTFDMYPYVSVFNQSTGYLEFDHGSSNTATNIEGDLIESWYSTFYNPVQGVYFDATKERPDSTRWVFIANNKDLYRINLTCDGLDSTGWKYNFNSYGGSSLNEGWRSEMEVYEDTAQNRIRVAIPFQQHSKSGFIKVALFDIDSVTGNVIPTSRQDIEFANNSNGSATYVHGLEFSPNGRGLYIMHDNTSPYSSVLSFYDISAQTLTDLPYTNLSNFKNSQLQVAGDSANYTLWMAGKDYLGGLFDPDNPSLTNPNPGSWNPTAIPLNNYPINLGGSSAYAEENIKRIVPDQIDYEDYVENVFFASCDCCEKYAYAGETMDTTYTALQSETWTYGLGNNPWDALSEDTIYIRDYLRIPAGIDVTIEGMYFKFGPEAHAIVERGNGSLPSARLHLDKGTVFSADFRCSRRDYHCEDPEGGCKDLKFWQGVRVEGFANETSQGGSKQAYFSMRNGSMIEYAVAGIHVGHETLADYGGGIISIRDSYLKDNLTGIKFDPYARLGGGIEFYNKSGIYRNSFITTDDWFSDQSPKAFIDVVESSGLYIKGNLFENRNTTTGFTYANRGIGIKTGNSRIEASWACANTPGPCQVPVQNPIRNVFKDLAYGIYGLNSGQNVRTLTCNYGLFVNNFIGTYLAGFIQPKILDNTFEVESAGHYSIGLFLNSSTGYDVQNNDFSTWQGATSGQRYGIYVSNSGEVFNEIYRNQFENLMVGGYVHGVNTKVDSASGSAKGLRWFCNTFDQPIEVADILLNGSMSDEQGVCGVRQADNLFSHSSVLNGYHYDLRSYYGSLTHIHYNYTDDLIDYPRLVPLKYSGQSGMPFYYQLSACQPPNNNFNPETSCPEILSGAPITEVIGPGMAAQGSGEPMSYATLSEAVAGLSAEITTLENQLSGTGSETESTDETEAELAQLKAQYRKLWHRAISQYQADTTGTLSTENLQSLLAEYQPQSAERFASILLPEASLGWIANDNLSAVEAFSGDVGLPAPVDGSLPYEIPEWFEGDFFGTASNTSALNALYIDNNEIYMPYIPPVAVDEADWNGYIPGNPGAGDNASSDLTVQPNPFNESVHFNFSNYEIKGKNNRLEFYDITGRKIFVKTIGEDQSQIELSGDHFPQGIVLYTLFVNNVARENGKIIRTE